MGTTASISLPRLPGVAANRRVRPSLSKTEATVSPLIIIFLLMMFMPATLAFYAFGSLITPYRLFLLVSAPAIIAAMFSSKNGFRSFDYLMIGYIGWVLLCVGLRQGIAIDSMGRHALETFFAYALGRFYVRSYKDFRAVAFLVFIFVIVSLPFAVAESIGRVHFVDKWGSQISGYTYHAFQSVEQYRIRWGLGRAMTSFEHPILYGLYSTLPLPLIWYASRQFKVLKSLVLASAGFFSLSSAAWLAYFLQVVLIASEYATRRLKYRAAIIAGGILSVGITIEIVSKSGLFSVIVRYMTLDPVTAANRIRIWNYGIETMYTYPIFGTDTWIRPAWMSDSIDNHWIWVGVQYGFPGLFLLLGVIGTIMYSVVRADGSVHGVPWKRFKAAWAITIAGFLLSGFSVAYFGKMQPFLFFVIGMGGGLVCALQEANKLRRRAGCGKITGRLRKAAAG